MAFYSFHRPATAWLSDLQKAKEDSNNINKPKVTIPDLIERVNVVDADPHAPESQLIPSSPRSVEACFRLGVDPVELKFKPINFFRRNGESPEITELRFKHFEGIRQERLQALVEERKRLIDDNFAPNGKPKKKGLDDDSKEATNEMLEKEKQRLDVLKRRQQRELEQMIQYETQRKELLDKQQRKLDAMEARAAELARQKAEGDAQWAAQQRERELQKMREDEEREAEAKRSAAERYKREQELQRREAEEQKLRQKEAMQRDIERRQKAEEHRRETERILLAQEEEVRQKKEEMDRRDKERAERLEIETAERLAANLIKRKKAEERIQSALESNKDIVRKKREDFERRERMNEQRRLQLEEFRRRQDEIKRVMELKKEAERQEKYQAALAQEEGRKQNIQAKTAEKQRVLSAMTEKSKRENERRRCEKELFNSLRLDKVDAMKKMNMWQRQQLLERIMDENDRTSDILEQRQQLQEARKMANMQASMHRQKLSGMMDSLMASSKSAGRLPSAIFSNGQRPATAHT